MRRTQHRFRLLASWGAAGACAGLFARGSMWLAFWNAPFIQNGFPEVVGIGAIACAALLLSRLGMGEADKVSDAQGVSWKATTASLSYAFLVLGVLLFSQAMGTLVGVTENGFFIENHGKLVGPYTGIAARKVASIRAAALCCFLIGTVTYELSNHVYFMRRSLTRAVDAGSGTMGSAQSGSE